MLTNASIPTWLFYLLVVAAFLVLSVFLVKFLSRSDTHRAVRRGLKKISYDYISSVSLDLGDEHFAYFDYIAVIDSGLLVIDVKDYAGHIFAADKIDMWTQIQNRKSYQFANPSFELQHKIELLKLKLQNHNITGIVVFTDHADFPKGQPDNVLLVKKLRESFKLLHEECAENGLWTDWLAFKKLEIVKTLN